MTIESEIFKKSEFTEEKLLQYGFRKEKGKFLLSKNILDNTFRIDIEINQNKELKGKIIDFSLNEEYVNYRTKGEKGEFSSNIRFEFINFLNDIKENCCTKTFFAFDQTNRICNLIINTYNNNPEFLWDKYPECAVFRNPKTKKWYAVIMNIKREKIDKKEGEAEIINLKLNKDKIPKLLSEKGIYKAYHMNKTHWISIILDETLDDKTIRNYIKESHQYTE